MVGGQASAAPTLEHAYAFAGLVENQGLGLEQQYHGAAVQPQPGAAVVNPQTGELVGLIIGTAPPSARGDGPCTGPACTCTPSVSGTSAFLPLEPIFRHSLFLFSCEGSELPILRTTCWASATKLGGLRDQKEGAAEGCAGVLDRQTLRPGPGFILGLSWSISPAATGSAVAGRQGEPHAFHVPDG